MKLNNRAFTLIELLGVMIILGLLVTLILPTVINSIKNSSNKTNEISEQLAINAVDLYIKDNKNYYDTANGTKFCISLIDLVNANYLKSPISYNDIDDITNTYSVKVTYNDKYSYELIDNNKCPEPIYVAKETPTTGIVPTIDSNGNFLPGSEFNIKVNDKIGYLTFFVLSNDGEYVNLIAEKNLTPNGALNSENQTGDEWHITLDNSYDNRYGPQTAYNYLSLATSNWTNIPVIESFNYLDEGNQSNSSYGYKSIVTNFDNATGIYYTTITPYSSDYGEIGIYENIKVRLPYYNEIINNTSCSTSNGSCPLWMVNYLASSSSYPVSTGKVNSTDDNYGYWLLSSNPGYNYSARYILSSGYISGTNTNGINRGIRPVITLKKSELVRAMEQM